MSRIQIKLFTEITSLRNFIALFMALMSVVCVQYACANEQLAGKIQHLEPSYWWVGMHNPKLQLMVHGKNIAKSAVRVDYAGVNLESVEYTDNPNFLFINLFLEKKAKVGKFHIEFTSDEYGTIRFPYELKQRVPGSATRKGFSSKDVIYLITPDRFANGDESNDSVVTLKEPLNRSEKGGRHGGDIQGIIDHLDYIEDMGFTQIWTMPLMENDMQKYSYHGYSTTDYYQIDPRFGSNELYRELSRQAKIRGVGIIQDVILNHIGSEHWWMNDKPSSDWVNNQGVFKPTTHMREVLHDPHGMESDKVGFNDGWFVPTMPDLNQRNPFLANYLIQNAIWWIEYANLSGLRVDTYSYSDMDFLSAWTKRLMTEYPNLNIVGEEWSVNPSIVAYWQTGSLRHSNYRSYLTSVMDFPTQAKLVSGLLNKETWSTGLREIYESIANDFVYGDPYNLVVFADNHDMSRVASQLNEDTELFRMAISFLLTTRGIPQLFYGTELFMTNPGTEDHGVIRSDFPGGWQSDPSNAFTQKNLTLRQSNMQQFVRTLLNWRKTSSAVTQGVLKHFAPKDGIYVYFRKSNDQTVMIIMNKNLQSSSLDLARFSEMLGQAKQAKDIIGMHTIALQDSLQINAKTTLILELQQ